MTGLDGSVGSPGHRRAPAPILTDTLDEALGRSHRDDPVMPRSGGPAGNARLTAWTGLVLLVLSSAELVTLIDVHGLIKWHIVIGTLLVPPALLKTGSTGWRIVRYYRRNPGYAHAGPPPMLLRILGPGVVVSTLGLLASGLLLILLGQDRSHTVLVTVLGKRVDWLTLHQGLFIVWAVLTGLHVLARIIPAMQLTIFAERPGRVVDGSRSRAAVLAASLVIAVVAAALVLATAGSWNGGERHGPRPGPGGVVKSIQH